MNSQKIKQKFYKANQTVRGSGIGLAVADEIVRLHNGRLDIDSVENVGTTVTISIPTIKPESENQEENDVEHEDREEDDLSRILRYLDAEPLSESSSHTPLREKKAPAAKAGADLLDHQNSTVEGASVNELNVALAFFK